MDHSESARENAKVRQAQNLLGRTTVRERNNLIECSLGAEAQLSHQPSAGWPWAGLISSAGLLFHICQTACGPTDSDVFSSFNRLCVLLHFPGSVIGECSNTSNSQYDGKQLTYFRG